MAKQLPRLILASRSPRRRELLAAAGYEFDVVEPSEEAEDGIEADETPNDLVSRLARQKATDVARRTTGGLVLGCDTVVECNGQILGKPADGADARAMLTVLSGQTHRVLSGLCLLKASGDCSAGCRPVPPEPLVRVAVTTLRMDNLTPAQLDAYLATGQWQGKAGAFGYQDGLDWVHVVEGSESNVVGLPMELLAEMLEELRQKGPATDPPKRPWYRPHRSTFLALALVIAVLVLLIVPGKRLSFSSDGTVTIGQYVHGWPWTFLRKPTSMGKLTDASPYDVAPWRTAASWRFASTDATQTRFYPGQLAADIVVASAILLAAGAAFECWRRRRLRAWQFSLREMFLLTLAVAAVGAWYRTNRQEADAQEQVGRLIESALPQRGEDHLWESYCGPEWLRRLCGSQYLGFLERPISLNLWPGDELSRIRSHIGGLRDLREISLVGSSVTDADLAVLATLRRLQSLHARFAKVKGVRWSALASRRSLRVLNLAFSDLTDDDLQQLAALDNVQKLSLAFTNTSPKGLRNLQRMTNLEELIVNGDAKDECLDAVVGMKRLRKLRILLGNLNLTVQRQTHPQRTIPGVAVDYVYAPRSAALPRMLPGERVYDVDFMDEGMCGAYEDE